MNKIRFVLAVLLCLLIAPVFAEPTNLANFRMELVKYHDDGQYERELAAVLHQAKAFLEKSIRRNHGRKLAIVFDIDETTLSNYQDMLELNFGGDLKEIDARIARGKDPVIQPSLQLYQFAKSKGISVFFVTGRREPMQNSTVRNLEEAGYHQWDGIYFKPLNYHQPSAIPYKVKARREITEKGYHILASIGDQLSDIEGGYAEKGFKLPNPYYHLP